jgi:hypothetical protein
MKIIMRFRTCNVRSLYRRELVLVKGISTYKLHLVGYWRSDGTGVALNQQANIHFSVERGMRIVIYIEVFCT